MKKNSNRNRFQESAEERKDEEFVVIEVPAMGEDGMKIDGEHEVGKEVREQGHAEVDKPHAEVTTPTNASVGSPKPGAKSQTK
ncbi:unnamed protein product [Linum trigynum]|uniref:Uncharacterized protein n=1 Tax=Linum trigynum TaxID=586398 RepID=A0AAV2DQR8_9ROSI